MASLLRSVLAALAASVLACPSLADADGQATGELAFVNVTVIDGTGAKARADQTVIVSGDRIIAAAKRLLDALFDVSGQLDRSVATVRDCCSESELIGYRRAIGNVLGEMWDGILRPILSAHPD